MYFLFFVQDLIRQQQTDKYEKAKDLFSSGLLELYSENQFKYTEIEKKNISH